jgi:hypothetical protein
LNGLLANKKLRIDDFKLPVIGAGVIEFAFGRFPLSVFLMGKQAKLVVIYFDPVPMQVRCARFLEYLAGSGYVYTMSWNTTGG